MVGKFAALLWKLTFDQYKLTSLLAINILTKSAIAVKLKLVKRALKKNSIVGN